MNGGFRRQDADGRISFPATVLKQGENTLTFCATGAGLMYDTIVLEAD
ncbi:MAG: hypothetical protein ABSG04_12855 [Verrucomicrobiota bacterium]